MLRPGTLAPDLELPDQNGQLFRLGSLKGQKNVVLFFYPTDYGAVCTKEACAFRDAYEDFVGLDTVVIGVSAQGKTSHQRFAQQFNLPFTLLSDKEGTASKAYGLGRWLGILNDRATFVIDKQGVIRAAVRNMISAQVHVRKALRTLEAQRSV
ncbi:MAG: peroxiredoxin [Flavobacteriales bacterium]|nr:peroxiredoxin [Flavobacteriales bacterium]